MSSKKFNNVLFAYNGRIEKDQEGNYYGNELNDTIVERYRILADKVVFLVRVRPLAEENIGRVLPFKHAQFSVCEMDNFSGPASYFRKFNRRKRNIERAVQNADIVIGRLPSSLGRLAISAARKFKKPYLVEVVGCPWDALWNHSLIGKFIAPIAFIKMRKQVAEAPFVLYVTEQFLQGRYPNRKHNIGVSDVIIDEINEGILNERKQRVEQFSKENIISIGTIAGIDVAYKGQSDVLKAMVILKELDYRFKYFIIGKGKGTRLRQQIKELKLEDDVEIVGQVPHDRIGSFIRKLDIYIQPSKMEGLPRAVVEALSYGCPCIGSNAGGIPELINAKMIFSKGNVNHLCNILKNIDGKILNEESSSNYYRARSFLPSILDKRRSAFFKEFIDSIP